MSDKIDLVSSKAPPKPTLEAPEAPSPQPATAPAKAQVGTDSASSYAAADHSADDVQKKLQPEQRAAVVPESHAGQQTKEALKRELLRARSGSRPASNAAVPDSTAAEPASSPAQPAATALTSEERAAKANEWEKDFYTPYAKNLTFKFAQAAYLPKEHQGVCAAMTMHWAARGLLHHKPSFADSKKPIVADDGKKIQVDDRPSDGSQRYHLDAEMGASSRRMEKKFAKYQVAQQAAADQHVVAARHEGLQLVGPTDGELPPEYCLFNARDDRRSILQHRAEATAAATQATMAKGDMEMAQMDAQLAKESPPSEQSAADLKSAQEAFAKAKQERKEALASQQEALAACKGSQQQLLENWVKQVESKLEPNKTYTVLFGGKDGHVTGVRTGPATAAPGPGEPRFASLDVMDPNIGEFHFDGGSAAADQARRGFLAKWGEAYLVKSDFDHAEFHEIKPLT